MKVTLEIKFGSDFQKTTGRNIVAVVLEALTTHLKRVKKKNKVDIIIED